MNRVTLDVRTLEHPKPLEYGIEALKSLDDHSYIYMLNRKNPIPLIRLAQEHGFQTLTHEAFEQEWHILISKNKELPLKEYLDV